MGLSVADVPPVVATVNGVPVPTWLYLSQVNFQLSVAESSSGPGKSGTVVTTAQRSAIEQQALAAVIEETLLVNYGETHGWAPTALQAAAEYQRVVQRRGGDAASRRQIAAQYLTLSQDQIVARYHLITQQVLNHYITGMHQPVVAALFRMIVTPTRAQTAQVRDLLVRTDRWVDLAARFSTDPVGRIAGGEQPIVSRDAGADPQLVDVVFHLSPTRLSAPAHLRQGWAIVEVLRFFPATNLYRTDLLSYKSWVARLRRQAQVTAYLPLPPDQP